MVRESVETPDTLMGLTIRFTSPRSAAMISSRLSLITRYPTSLSVPATAAIAFSASSTSSNRTVTSPMS